MPQRPEQVQIPLDVAFALLEEAMRDAMKQYGLLASTVDHLAHAARVRMDELWKQLNKEESPLDG